MLLRRVRGLLVLMFSWSVVWGAVGAVYRVVQSFFFWRAQSIPVPEGTYATALAGGGLFWAIRGAMSGLVFALVLMLVERRRNVETLSLPLREK